MDLLDFFRHKHSWRKLALLVRNLRLSDRSALVEAQAQDPDHAEWVLSQPETPQPGPAVSDYTPDHAMLVEIRDVLAELVAVTVAGIPGNKYHRPTPSKRPSTAISRLRAKLSKAKHNSLVDEVKAAQERWVATHGE